MKLLFVTAFLAMTFLATAEDLVPNASQKKEFAEVTLDDLANNLDGTCMDQLKPIFVETIVKHMSKFANDQPMFKDDGKERTFTDFVKHSKVFKTATNTKCLTSLVTFLMKAAKVGGCAIFTMLCTLVG